MELGNVFINFIAEETLNIDNSKIERFCRQEKIRDPAGHIISNRGGWQSKRFKYFPTEFQDISHIVNDRFKYLSEYFNFKPQQKLILDFWININRKNSYHYVHSHELNLFSAVYYVKVPENSGSIVFHNPQKMYSSHISEDMINSYNSFNSATYTLNPSEGKLIIFPAWLEHEVLPTDTYEERISISFNSFGPTTISTER